MPNRRRRATARVVEKEYTPLNRAQEIVWRSEARVTAAVSGHFGGKSHLGAYWILDQTKKYPGQDFIVCGTNFKTLGNSAIPKMRSLFGLRGMTWEFDQHEQIGFRAANMEYWLPDGGVIYIRSADRPGSMQGAHVKGIWMDETVDTTFYVYETLLGRMAGLGGKMLITTTPYDRGWLYEQVYKPWVAAGRPDGAPGSNVCVAQWRSIDNPTYPRAEWENLKAVLPEWRFRMLYEGQFERPMGLVYDCFADSHWINPFEIPPEWPRVIGLDFGFTDPTAAIWIAKAPDGGLYAYDEYYKTGWMAYAGQERNEEEEQSVGYKRVVGQQAMRLELIDEIVARCADRHENIVGVYCDHDEDLTNYALEQFWDKMGINRVYMAAKGPGSILAGIERNYVLVRQGNFRAFNNLLHFKDEVDSYSWKVDDTTGEIKKDEPKGGKDHLLDAWRYATVGSPDEPVNSFGFGSLPA